MRRRLGSDWKLSVAIPIGGHDEVGHGSWLETGTYGHLRDEDVVVADDRLGAWEREEAMTGPIQPGGRPTRSRSIVGLWWSSFPASRVPITIVAAVLLGALFATGRGLFTEVLLDTEGVPGTATVIVSTSVYRVGQDTVARFTPQGQTAPVTVHVRTDYVDEPPDGFVIPIEYVPGDPSDVRVAGDHADGITCAACAALFILAGVLTHAHRKRLSRSTPAPEPAA